MQILSSSAAGAMFGNQIALADASDAPTIASPRSEVPTYYISTDGNDASNGLTPQTAWASINKANIALPVDRSNLLFQRGGTFYGELELPFGCRVGAYGEGPKPILTMYKLLHRPEGWIKHADSIWKIDLGSPYTHDGYTTTTDANIGFLLVDNAVKPALKFSLRDLANAWDFYCDVPANTLFVKSEVNPTSVASEIKAAPNGSGTVIYCPNGRNEIRDVHVTGSGGCGIRGNGSDVHIQNCLVDYIGGSWLKGHGQGTSRYGNGIENWPNVSRWTIENNEIAHVYDVAWSPQGLKRNGDPVHWEDMNICNNYIHDCSQMFELWSESNNNNSPGFVRIRIAGNVCERAGYGAFAHIRPDQKVRVHLLTYNLQTPVDVTIENNIFDESYGAYSYHAFPPPSGYITRNNIIRLRAGTKMEYQRRETVEQAAIWQASTGREIGSTISVYE